MRQIRQILRLAGDGISARMIGRMLGVARFTCYQQPAQAAASYLLKNVKVKAQIEKPPRKEIVE
jgi:hypothetical protein